MPEDEHFLIERMNVTQQSAKQRLEYRIQAAKATLERSREVRAQLTYRDDGVPYTHLQENL